MNKIVTPVLSLIVILSSPYTALACITLEDENRSVFEKVADWIQHSITIYPLTALVVLVVMRVILKRKGIQRFSKTLTVLMVSSVVLCIAFFILETMIKSTCIQIVA